MLRMVIALVSGFVISCTTNSDDTETRAILGYTAGGVCTQCGKANSNGLYAWEIYRDSTRTIKFFIYGEASKLSTEFFDGMFYQTLSGTVGTPVYDEGDQCLNYDQPKKDTVVIDGQKVIVDVVQEPCMPFLLDKDIP